MAIRAKYNLYNKKNGHQTYHFETETIQIVDLPNVILYRNTNYSIGNIVYSKNLPSYLRLECIKPGITGTVEPDFSQISWGGV